MASRPPDGPVCIGKEKDPADPRAFHLKTEPHPPFLQTIDAATVFSGPGLRHPSQRMTMTEPFVEAARNCSPSRGLIGTPCRDPVNLKQCVRLTKGRRKGFPTPLSNTSYGVGVGVGETTVSGVIVTVAVVITPPAAVAVAMLVT